MKPLPPHSSAPAPVQPEPEPFRITHERGPMPRQIRAAALAAGGESCWRAVLERVSPACRARFSEPIGYYDWVESPLAIELHEAWAAESGFDDMGRRGETAALEMLGGVQRWILRLATTAFVVENIPRVIGFYYRGGVMRLVEQGRGWARIEYRASGYPMGWFRDGLSAGIAAGLRQTGVTDVAVQHSAPGVGSSDPHLHIYEITWKA